jgi:serine/threonine protein kinase
MAPEIFLNKPYDGAPVDIFSAGIVLFLMRTGGPPFLRAVESDGYFL